MSLKSLQKVEVDHAEWVSLLKQVVDRLTGVRGDIRVILFGSLAKNRVTAESDIDLAVIIPEDLSSRQFLGQLYTNRVASHWPLDLVVLSKTRFEQMKDVGGVCFDIHAEGRELYPRWEWNDAVKTKI